MIPRNEHDPIESLAHHRNALKPALMRPDAMWLRPRWRRVWAISSAVIIHLGLLMVLQGLLNAPPQFETRYRAAPMQARLIDVRIVADPLPSMEQDSSPSPVPPPLGPAVTPPPTVEPDTRTPAIAATAKPAALEPAANDPVAAAAPANNPDGFKPPTSETEPTPLPTPAPSLDATIAATSSARPHAAGQPRLVTPDGQVLLPEVDRAAQQFAARFPLKPRPARAGSSTPFSHRSPLPYVATRFERVWVPPGETLVDTFLRKVTKTSSAQVGGIQFDCTWVLVVAGCSWGPIQRMSIDELKRMRADVPMPRGPRTQPGS